MSGGKSTTYANDYLEWALTTATVNPTRPTGWQIALYSDASGRSTAPVTEVTASNCPGYSRQTVNFNTPSNGSTSNSNDVAFTATGAPWTPVNYYAILDQAGNMIYWAPTSTQPRTLGAIGDKIDFAVGSISISES